MAMDEVDKIIIHGITDERDYLLKGLNEIRALAIYERDFYAAMVEGFSTEAGKTAARSCVNCWERIVIKSSSVLEHR